MSTLERAIEIATEAHRGQFDKADFKIQCIMKVTTLYFSATYTTRKVVEEVAKNLSNEVTAYDITNDAATDEVAIPADELMVVGVPV